MFWMDIFFSDFYHSRVCFAHLILLSAFLDGALQVSEELARVLEPGLHLPGHTTFLLGCGRMAVFPSRSCLVIDLFWYLLSWSKLSGCLVLRGDGRCHCFWPNKHLFEVLLIGHHEGHASFFLRTGPQKNSVFLSLEVHKYKDLLTWGKTALH